MRVTKVLAIIIASFLLLVSGIPTHAAVIYSTFGPGDTYGPNAWSLGGPGYNYEVASSFSLTSTSTFGSIDIALYSYNGVNVNVYLIDKTANTTIESFVISVPGTQSILNGSIYTAISILNPILSASNEYWIALSVVDPSVQYGAVWYKTNQEIYGLYGRDKYNTTWQPYPLDATAAFAINDTAPVPEPSTMLLLGSGLVGLVGYGRRRMKK